MENDNEGVGAPSGPRVLASRSLRPECYRVTSPIRRSLAAISLFGFSLTDSPSRLAISVPCCWRGPRFLLAELFPFMFLRTLPVGFMASLPLLLSMSDLALRSEAV